MEVTTRNILSGRVLNSIRLSTGSPVLAELDRFVCSSPSGHMEYGLAVTSRCTNLALLHIWSTEILKETEVHSLRS